MSTATDQDRAGDLPDDPATVTDWRGIGDDGTTAPDGDARPGGLKLAGGSRKLVRELARPHRGRLILAGLVILLDQAVSVAGPLLIAYGIDTAVPALMDGDRGPMFLAVGLYLFTAAASALTRLVFVRMSGRISQDVLRGLRARVFDHAQQLSVSFHEKYTSGRVISRMTSDLETIGETLETGINDLIAGLLSVVVISGVLLWLDPTLGAVSLLAFVPLFFVTRWFQRRSLTIYRGSRTAMASLIVQFTETMNGLRAVQTFRREPRNARIFAEDNDRFARNDGDALVVAGIYSPAVRLIGNVALTAVMILGAVFVVNGSLEVGILAAFLLYLRRMYDPMDELAMFYNQAQSAAAALEKIATLLAQQPSVREPVDPTPLPQPRGELRFEGVGFGYSAEREVLPRFDLTVPAGQTIALVGATGAGKTTLARLLARFYDPTEGRVRLDGVDLRELANDDLRRALVMVTQESFLFSGSVADNIALGKPSATRAEIEAAAEAVGVADFVNALPQGYDTDVRRRGGRLSAGQRQLVAFARAFLADPAVLILDEATASLDIPSERAVQSALHRVLHGRTAVIIAHRLSTVSIADRVLVMDQGRIVEDGSPAELIAGKGRFAQLDTAWRESLA
ncbi:ABC transporter ATP-binding protein [Nakamurella deserti]|uniref:ABC transporter ATP-binding protein n=1 Tax=Nakamurella deserti TaxID=2164074 RepID=UPI000DBE8140|nr:ABC transporter ATP-binding protein [Nakamurella deserti]